jgi:hypothetical protein
VSMDLVVAGEAVAAVVVNRPHRQALTLSDYLEDGSDFAGYVPRVGTSAPYVPFAIGAKEHWRLVAPSDDPGVHAPWRITTSLAVSQHSGLPVYDPVLAIGYNAAAEGNPAIVSEPSWTLQWEADWHDGNSRKMEFYIQYIGESGARSFRPYFIQVDRVTHEVTATQYQVGRTTGFSWSKGYDDFAEFAVLTEGLFAMHGRTGDGVMQVVLSTLRGKQRAVQFLTEGGRFPGSRWEIRVDGDESGSDAGSVFTLVCFGDVSGGETPISISRVAGAPIVLGKPLQLDELRLDPNAQAPIIAADQDLHLLTIWNGQSRSYQLTRMGDGRPTRWISGATGSDGDVAFVLDTHARFTNPETKLVSVRAAGSEKFYIDHFGGLSAASSVFTTTPGISAPPLELEINGASFNHVLYVTDTQIGGKTYGIVLGGGNFELYDLGPGKGRIFATHYDNGIVFDRATMFAGNIGFFNTVPRSKPTVSGSRVGNTALASLLTQLASLGLLTDSTT